MEIESQKFCWFDTVPKNTTIWKYKRAINGHKLILIAVNIISEGLANFDVVYQVMDGHAYSHWGNFPNIFDQSTLAITNLTTQQRAEYIPLNNWECKEVTLSASEYSNITSGRFAMILWFYEVPMSKTEKLEYAVKQPRYKYRHGSARTLDRFE